MNKTELTPEHGHAYQAILLIDAQKLDGLDRLTAIRANAEKAVCEREKMLKQLERVKALNLAHWSESGFKWWDGNKEHEIPAGLGRILIDMATDAIDLLRQARGE